jgi:hypothetical protein
MAPATRFGFNFAAIPCNINSRVNKKATLDFGVHPRCGAFLVAINKTQTPKRNNSAKALFGILVMIITTHRDAAHSLGVNRPLSSPFSARNLNLTNSLPLCDLRPSSLCLERWCV